MGERTRARGDRKSGDKKHGDEEQHTFPESLSLSFVSSGDFDFFPSSSHAPLPINILPLSVFLFYR